MTTAALGVKLLDKCLREQNGNLTRLSRRMRTRTEMTIEIDRWVVIKRQPKSDWCPNCLRQVEMIDEAALLAPEGLLLISRTHPT